MAKDITYVLRIMSCMFWGLGGAVVIGVQPLVGVLSIFSATLFLIAIVVERNYE